MITWETQGTKSRWGFGQGMTSWPARRGVTSKADPALTGRVIVDPGLGFGKGPDANLALCKEAGTLSAALKCPVMVGPSRKRFVAARSGVRDPDRAVRDFATIGASLAAVESGAHIVRVHHVEGLAPALRLFSAIRGRG